VDKPEDISCRFWLIHCHFSFTTFAQKSTVKLKLDFFIRRQTSFQSNAKLATSVDVTVVLVGRLERGIWLHQPVVTSVSWPDGFSDSLSAERASERASGGHVVAAVTSKCD